MAKLLDQLAFTDNPFATYVAENEPNISAYFIRPPYFHEVHSRAHASRSFVLFGARGAGKSATRLAYYKEAWAAVQEGEKLPLVVTLDDFSRIVADGLPQVDLGRFVAEVGYLVVESLLVWLAALEQEERELVLGTLTEEELGTAIALIDRFYLSRPELVRAATITAPLKLLNAAWQKRTALWVGKRWDAIIGLVGTIAQAIARRKTDVEVSADGIRELLKSDKAALSDAQFARAIFGRMVRFAQAFGFSGVTVLIDKVDETQPTNNSVDATAALLYPLLSNTQMLEVEGFGWLLFLWDKVREPYSTGDKTIRLDKIAHAAIAWEDGYLEQLISERLRHFSENRVQTFAALCEPDVEIEALLQEVVRLSMRSPRELIRIMDTIIREHDDRHASENPAPRLDATTIDVALDKYTAEKLPQTFPKNSLQQVVRLRKTVFVNRDIQAAFKINDQSARNRIQNWTDVGLAALTGTRQAEGGAGGKPANEYSIADHRVRRAIERKISLGIEYDLFEDTPSDDGVGA